MDIYAPFTIPATINAVNTPGGGTLTRVRLTRKLANRLNGVDLSGCGVGDILDLRSDAASILIDAGWAEIWVEQGLARPRVANTKSPAE